MPSLAMLGLAQWSLLTLPLALGSLLRGAPPGSFTSFRHGDSSSCHGCDQAMPLIQLEGVDMPTVAVDDVTKCTCTVSGDSCDCSGCDDGMQVKVCTQLLGPCACQRFDEAICECSGYCHRKADREEACWDEAGCTWSGQWCEAEVGLLWSG